jgi:argininosuccinate lyase
MENLWGGRFTEKADESFAMFNNSFSFDKRLFFADVQASMAHAEGLQNAGILSEDAFQNINNGLLNLIETARIDDSFFDFECEDIHSFIETKLIELIGDDGRKLHTGRSRNDQVATAFRIWLREEIGNITAAVIGVQRRLVDIAELNKDAVFVGYTHLQKAQPILFAHWCLAYFEMFTRDCERLSEAFKRTNISPLGSAALAGTSYEINRESVADKLGFNNVSANSLDAVSDRDFVIEFLGACSLIMVHLSRISEDLIIYATNEFGFIELSDAVSTGSSLMPQKKNPDALELIRGKAGRVFGHQIALLTTIKGLPLAYNKDMQEDKEAVFDTVDTVKLCLNVAEVVLKNVRLRKDVAETAANCGYLNATELADYLVKKGVPFRTAHDTVGKVILFAMEKKKELHELNLNEFATFSDSISEDVFEAIGLKQTLESKNQIGGTSPKRVLKALIAAKAWLAER